MAKTAKTPGRVAPVSTRDRIIAAAARLISQGGQGAATTRAVAEAAGVQAPAIYRIFGDKQGLLTAVVDAAMGDYISRKARRQDQDDPVAALREGWDVHYQFGMQHPVLFAVMSSEPAVLQAEAVQAGLKMLQTKIGRVAESGRLKIPQELAAALMQSSCVGAVLTALSSGSHQTDGLAAAARDAAIAAITGETMDEGAEDLAGICLALRARLKGAPGLSQGERLLLGELLSRLASAPHH